MKKFINIIVPVFNNENSIVEFYNDINFNIKNIELNVLFIDDGSTDHSRSIIEKLSLEKNNVKYIFFQKNFGQIAAIEAGLNHSTADANVFVSADMQDSIMLINQMIEFWLAGSSIVIAHRAKRSDSFVNSMLSDFFYGIIRFSIPEMPDGGFDYCLLDQTVVKYLNQFKYKNRFFQGEVLSGGFNVSYIPYERKIGTSSKRLKNFNFKLKYFIDGVINSGISPIRLISILGVLTTLTAFIYSIAIVIEWFKGNTPFEGWAPLMISVLFSSGIVLSTLGILGEYIWRIYDEVKNTPRYNVEKMKI